MINLTQLTRVIEERDAANAAMRENGSRLYLEDQDAYEALFERHRKAHTAFDGTARANLPALVAALIEQASSSQEADHG